MINDTTRKNIHVDKANPIPLWGVKELDDVMLKVALLKNNSPFDITGQTVTLGVQSAAGLFEQSTGITIEGDKLDIRLKNGIIAKQGTCKMDLAFKDANGQMTSASFFMTVDPKVLNEEALQASDEFDSLTKAAQEIKEAVEKERIREENELKRQENEISREKAETNREAAETSRVEAESLRGIAEAGREKRLRDVEIKATNNATQIADIVKYQASSNVDLDGNIHPTLKARLEADNIILLDRMNNASYLPYEKEFITASNSFKGLTKELVVKGRTLQNLWDYNKQGINGVKDNGYIKLVANGAYPLATTTDISMFKPNTIYTLIVDTTEYTIDTNLAVSTGNVRSIFPVISDSITKAGISIHKITTRQSFVGCDWGLQTSLNKATTGQVKFRMIILEGDYTNKLIPSYFEGIKSINEDGENLEVVSCGKNLFNHNYLKQIQGTTYELVTKDGRECLVPLGSFHNTWYNKILPIKFKQNTQYTMKIDMFFESDTQSGLYLAFKYADGTSQVIVPSALNKWGTTTIISSANKSINYMYINYSYGVKTFFDLNSIRLNEGTIIIDEPYQEHRLPIKMKNLRGLPNGVADTDGVRRVGKVILNGSENWTATAKIDDTKWATSIPFPNLKPTLASGIYCDKLLPDANWKADSIYDYDVNGGRIAITVSNIKTGVTSTSTVEQATILIKAWLQANPVTVYYELTTPTKEEGNTEQLRTYDGQSNIFTEGSLIQPNISCKVPSNVQAVVSTLRLENEALNNEVSTLQATEEENNLTSIESSVEQDYRLSMLELGL